MTRTRALGARSVAHLIAIVTGVLLTVVAVLKHGVVLSPTLSARYAVHLLGERSEGARPTFVMLFKPTDCPGNLDVIDHLNALARQQTVGVVGLVVADGWSSGALEDVIAANKVAFEVRRVTSWEASVFAAAAGRRETPLLLVSHKGLLKVTLIPDLPPP